MRQYQVSLGAESIPSVCGKLIRLLILGRLCGVITCPGLGVCWSPYGAACWTADEFIWYPPPADTADSLLWLWRVEDCDSVGALVFDEVLEGIVLKLSKALEEVGVTGVTGLVGWLEDGSVLSSLVLFFLRNPKVGICYDVGERRAPTFERDRVFKVTSDYTAPWLRCCRRI